LQTGASQLRRESLVQKNQRYQYKVRKLRNQDGDDSEEWLQHTELGYNYRISDINCALGIGQLMRIDVILERREWIADEYSQRLRCNPDLNLPPMALPHRKISWFVYVVRLSSRFNQGHRDWIVDEMRS
jgi:perosamine synthetase